MVMVDIVRGCWGMDMYCGTRGIAGGRFRVGKAAANWASTLW